MDQPSTPQDPETEMISRRLIPRIALLGAFALFCAQILLASHEIEHLGHNEQESCEICLVGAAIGSPLISSAPASTFAPHLPLFDAAFTEEPLCQTARRSRHARAPPTPVRL